MATITFRPTGAGFYTDGIANGAANKWDCVDETTSDGDSTYINYSSGSSSTTFLITTNTITNTDTINSITVYNIARATTAGKLVTAICNPTIYEGGTLSTASYSSNIPTSYQTYSKTWTTVPSTGNAWTKGDIDALEIGETCSTSTNIRVTQVYIVVDYTSSGPAPGTFMSWFTL